MRIPRRARSPRQLLRGGAIAAVAAALLVGASGGSQAVATTATVASPTAAGASFTAVDFAWTTNGNQNTNGSTVTIQAGQTVTFSYPSGSSVHNADFNDPSTNAPPAAPPLCQRTDGSDSGADPPLPHSPQGPGWAGQCTFNTPGTYSFHCDAHPFMTGTIDVVAATSTTTSSSASSTSSSSSSSSSVTTTTATSTSATTTSTTVASTSTSTSTYGATSTTTSAGATRPGGSEGEPAFVQIDVSPRQHGRTVRGSVRVVGSRLRLSVVLRAERAAIAPASTSSASVTIAHMSRHPIGPGKVSFALQVSAKPAVGRKLSLVLVLALALTSADRRTVTKDRDVTLTLD